LNPIDRQDLGSRGLKRPRMATRVCSGRSLEESFRYFQITHATN
jgi:hypothetical protein